MPDESQALSTIPAPVPEEIDYDAICAAVMQTERGRWFLDEYARRNRNADTQLVLAAIERLETVIRSEHARTANAGLQSDLVDIAKAFALQHGRPAETAPQPRVVVDTSPAQPDADARRAVFETAARLQDVAWKMRECGLDRATCTQVDALAVTILSAPSLRDPNDRRAEKLAEVLVQLERRIEAMIAAAMPAEDTGAPSAHESPALIEAGNGSAQTLPPEPPNDADASKPAPIESGPPDVAAAVTVEIGAPVRCAPSIREGQAQQRLLAKPLPETPELRRASASPPPHRAADDDDAQIDDDLFDTVPVPGEVPPASPAGAARPLAASAAAAAFEPPPCTATPAPRPAMAMTEPLDNDPLLALKSMSDEERIALFT